MLAFSDCLWRGNFMFIYCGFLGKRQFPYYKHALILTTLWYSKGYIFFSKCSWMFLGLLGLFHSISLFRLWRLKQFKCSNLCWGAKSQKQSRGNVSKREKEFLGVQIGFSTLHPIITGKGRVESSRKNTKWKKSFENEKN